MAEIPTWFQVAAAVIRDDEGRLLLQRQGPGKRHAGLWEFPGGKVEPDENARSALRREVEEELGLMLEERAMTPAGFADQQAEGGHPAIVLILYDCPVWAGEAEAREGQPWGWFTPAEAARLTMPPMDRALLESLPR